MNYVSPIHSKNMSGIFKLIKFTAYIVCRHILESLNMRILYRHTKNPILSDSRCLYAHFRGAYIYYAHMESKTQAYEYKTIFCTLCEPKKCVVSKSFLAIEIDKLCVH